MSFSSLMNNTGTCSRPTHVADGYGGYTETMSDIYTDFPCRIQPITGEKLFIYRRRGVETTHNLFCDSVYSILERDTITVSGNDYDVTSVRNIDELNHHNEIDLRRVKPEV